MGVYGYFNRPVYPDDIQIRRTWDIEEMRNVAHKFSFYQANNERERGISECWVSDPENMKTASFGRNWGYYVGMDEVKKYYLAPDKTANFLGGMHPMTSWVIEQAEDGKTAQGIWYCISQETIKGPAGDKGMWYAEKIGIDFIKEDDGWKIWHYFAGCDIACGAGERLSDQASEIEDKNDYINPAMIEFGEPTIKMKAYSVRYNWSHYPPLPTPHKTYADTTNCGPTGNPNYKG